MRTRALLARVALGGAVAGLAGGGGCGGTGLGAAPGRATAGASSGSPVGGALTREFVGVVAPDLLAGSASYRTRELALQARAGIGLLRQTFDWAQIETRPHHYRFGAYDALVLEAAADGIAVLPVLFHPPRFYSSAPAGAPARPTYPPRRAADMAAFATALVARYGPGGSLWATAHVANPVPIRAWQVWNEPNLPVYWGGRPDARGYARLLSIVAPAIHRAEPGATVLTAGLPNSRLGIPFDSYLMQLYRAGASRWFDVLAVNPYAVSDGGVVAALTRSRSIMRAHGDAAKPIWVTEVGWASGGPRSSFTVGAAAQARLVGRLVGELIRRRVALGVRGVVYYAWRDVRPYPGGKDFWGLHTGLVGLGGRPKPALGALTAALAGAR